AGKNNTIYLVDRDRMGTYHEDDQVVQALVNIFPFGVPEPGNYSAPVYFNGSIYFGPIADNIQKFQLSGGLLSATATSRSLEVYQYPGAALAISANGSANGILWAVQRNGDCSTGFSCETARPGVLRACEPGSPTRGFWALGWKERSGAWGPASDEPGFGAEPRLIN